jgi:hypothetical protein
VRDGERAVRDALDGDAGDRWHTSTVPRQTPYPYRSVRYQALASCTLGSGLLT